MRSTSNPSAATLSLAAEAKDEEHLHGPPVDADVVEADLGGPSGRDSAGARFDHPPKPSAAAMTWPS